MNDVSSTNKLARGLDLASMALLVLAMTTGMLLGSGVSASARCVFQIVAALAFVTCVCSMAASGRWRLAKSPIWLLPIAVVGLAALQLAPLGNLGNLASGPAGAVAASGPAAISVNRHATMQWMWWAGAVGLFMVAASHQFRSAGRLQITAILLAAVLGLSGLLGGLQVVAGKTSSIFGLFSVRNPALSAILRDLFTTNSALGLPAYQPWRQVEAANDALTVGDDSATAATWYVPEIDGNALFAGFLQSGHWAACVVALAPLLLATALNLASGLSWRECFSQPEGQQALGLMLLAMSLIGWAAWFADPIAVVAAVLFATVAVRCLLGPAIQANGELRRTADDHRMLRTGSFMVAVALLVGGVRLWSAGGLDALSERWQVAMADNLSLCRALGDFAWFGCGLGSVADIWPLYRPNPAEIAPQASSLLSLLAQTGLAGATIAFAALAYCLARWFRIRDTLDDDSRLILGSLVAGLTGLGTMGLFGPGLESPVALVTAAAIAAAVARGLAGGFREEERGWIA